MRATSLRAAWASPGSNRAELRPPAETAGLITKGSSGGSNAAPGGRNLVGTTGTPAAARSVRYRSLSVFHSSTGSGLSTHGSDRAARRSPTSTARLRGRTQPSRGRRPRRPAPPRHRARRERRREQGNPRLRPGSRRTSRAPLSDVSGECPQTRLDQPGPVLLDDLAVQLDPPALAQILDQVPVERADVLAADVRVALTERHVDRAGHLLVEEDVARRARDPLVAADPELADEARAVVHRQRREQRLLALLGVRVLDPTRAERQPDAVDCAAVELRRDVEQNRPLGRVLDRREEELAARHVREAAVDLALPARERELQVRVLADDPHLLRRVEPLVQALHRPGLLVPVAQAGAVEEVLEVGEPHPRLLRQRVRRKLAADPGDLVRHR